LEPLNLGSPNPTDRPVMAALTDHIPIPSPVLRLMPPDRIEFEARAGFVFQPEVSHTLTEASWIPLGPGITGDGQSDHLGLSNAAGASRFYRVRVMRSP
jgi:hypothetical protein